MTVGSPATRCYVGEDVCDSLSLPQAESGIAKIMNQFKKKKESVCVNYNTVGLVSLARGLSNREMYVTQGEKHCSCANSFIGDSVGNLWI